nr:glycosyltransferase family 2 protein [bacterium]
MNDVLLSVVVPMFNEEEVIAATHDRLVEVLSALEDSWEVVLVDDGSRDKTLSIAQAWAEQDERFRLVSFARNFGHQAAVTAGLEYARGQAIVIIDADLQDPPELIPRMLELWRQGWDVVYGKRSERKGETAFKKMTASAFYKVMSALTDGVVPKDTGDFRLIDRRVRDAILSMPEHGPFLRGMVAWVGFKQVPLEYVREPRFAGTTKYPLKK